jgi:hypothetical protein
MIYIIEMKPPAMSDDEPDTDPGGPLKASVL